MSEITWDDVIGKPFIEWGRLSQVSDRWAWKKLNTAFIRQLGLRLKESLHPKGEKVVISLAFFEYIVATGIHSIWKDLKNLTPCEPVIYFSDIG